MDVYEMNCSLFSACNVTVLPLYLHSLSVALSCVLLYVLVFLFCVCGNGLVCVVELRNRSMHSATNLFILNLAISDLLVGVVCMPVTLIDSLIAGWPFSQITCTLSNLVQGMSVSAFVFSLIAIAVDRCTGTMYPICHRPRPVTTLFAMFFIWLLAFAITLPSATTLTVNQLDNTYIIQDNQTYPLFVCHENWPKTDMKRIYTTVIFVHVYLAPLALISIMYVCIATKLSKKLRHGGVSLVRRERSKRRLKVMKMLNIVATLFMLSWLPLWTLMLLTDYKDLTQQQIEFLSTYLFPVAHWLAFLNSGVNPIIYSFFNKKYRRSFQAAIACRSWNSSLVTMCSRLSVVLPVNKVSNRDGLVNSEENEPQRPSNQDIPLENLNRLPRVEPINEAWIE